MEERRCQELRPKSTVILDNTRFDLREDVNRMADYNEPKVMFLPPYWLDLNPTEKVSAILKKKPCLVAKGTTIDPIIKSYGLF